MSFRVESLADLPPKLREQAALQIVTRKQQKQNKYGNTPAEVNGIKFDSKKEARRFSQLLSAQKAGYITDLRLQHTFTLQEAYTTPAGERIRAVKYKADFTYKLSQTGWISLYNTDDPRVAEWLHLMKFTPGIKDLVVEDVKSSGTKTKEYNIKKKLMADKGYYILEV